MNIKPFLSLLFFNMDISLNIKVSTIQFSTGIDKNHMQGNMSQIFYLGLGLYFIAKKG